ncbi:MAG TPA: MerR family transcriptional regulator, partial [Candidatus Acidoferrum sp.]
MSSAATPMMGEETRMYRIGEVSRLADLKPFVLRYWETEFPMLQPVKSPRGYRLYRQEDVDLVLRIKRLLYDEGFTIAGARRHLLEQGPGSSG